MFVEPEACARFSRLKRERMTPYSIAPLVVVPFIFMQSFKETLIPSGWLKCRLQNQQMCYWYRGSTSLFPSPAPLEQFIALLQQNPSSTTHPINALVLLTLLTMCKNFNLLQLFFIFMAFTYHYLGYLIGGSLFSFPVILFQFLNQIAGLRVSDFHNVPFFCPSLWFFSLYQPS